MTRAALYARYSTEMQRDASIADQIHACRALADRLGAQVVRVYSDAAISGQTLARPDFQAMMAAADAGEFDILICEHTDRLTRDGGHSYDIFYELQARDVRIVTVNQGEIGLMHVGTSGLMSAMFIEELRKKVRRGLEGVVREGRYAGSVAYGYRIPKVYTDNGERVRGLREIVEEEAVIVRRIFEETAAGVSALAICKALNEDSIPSPKGGLWRISTIHGHPKIGGGILRNELYRGEIVWGKRRFVKDRRTGGVHLRVNPAERATRPAPELRIVSDELWARAHAQLAARALGPVGEGRGQRRPKTLLGGLVYCGVCGSKMVRAGPGDALRCDGRIRHGTECTNNRAPGYARLEARALAAVQANLLHPDVVADAASEFQRHAAGQEKAAAKARAQVARELTDTEKRMNRLIAEVENGMPWSAVAGRHAELQARADNLKAQLAENASNVVPLRANASALFKEMVESLSRVMSAGDARRDAKAREAVRSLFDQVRFHPGEGKGKYELEILADLAPVIWGAEPMRATMCSS